jgi:hypothetical protein
MFEFLMMVGRGADEDYISVVLYNDVWRDSSLGEVVPGKKR